MIKIAFYLGKLLSSFDYKILFVKLSWFYTALYTGFIAHRFLRLGNNTLIYKPRLLIGEENIEIGNNVRIDPNVQLTAWNKAKEQSPIIKIGTNVNIGESAHITACNLIVIGDNFLCGKNVLITDNSHGAIKIQDLLLPPCKRLICSKGPVLIDKNVWVGDKVSILPNIKIGEGAVIAANSVVTKDIPPYCVAAGIPATIIKNLKS